MIARFLKRRGDESGMSFVFVGMGFMAFMAASTLAVDVGMLMTARSQAQNSADAGALAGAVALGFNSFTDRSPSGPAVQSAINGARANTVMGGTVSVKPPDVTFPLDPFGQPTRVKVNVYRTTAREEKGVSAGAVPTLIGSIFGVTKADVSATATAEASPADAETCVMPFTIPDKWIEHVDEKCKADGSWNPSMGFDIYAAQGNKQNTGAACSNPDVYVKPGSQSPPPTGYSPTADKGLEIVLKNNNQNKVSPSMYNPWDLPGSTGGDDYRNNIANCNTNIVKIGDKLVPETGNMVGPTKQGTDELIAKDPNAVWDTGCNCVKGSKFAISPRIAVIPLYDPYRYALGQQSGKSQPDLYVTNYLGFFIEEVNSAGEVLGRITPIGGLVKGNGGPATGAFPVAIRLVQ